MKKKKKIFFILSSLNAGGAERVFWLLSQYFDKSLFSVSIVLLDSRNPHFSTDLEGVRVISLETIRASRSFFKLLKLIKKEAPDAIFTTGGQINTLVASVSLFVKIPVLIARPTNEAGVAKFASKKSKILGLFKKISRTRYHKIVCQSDEIREAVVHDDIKADKKVCIIPNPVVPTQIVKDHLAPNGKRLIVAARLEKQKGHERLLKIFKSLPNDYSLTIAGKGKLKDQIIDQIKELGLQERVQVCFVNNVPEVIAQHDVFVLPSFVEGFPNAVAEALSVGVPVVAFKVGGISQLVRPGFNGFIVGKDETEEFRNAIITACQRSWDAVAIKNDAIDRFSIEKIARKYEELL